LSDNSDNTVIDKVELPSEDRTGFWPELGSSLRQRTGTWIVATIFAILTIFSDNLAERIKSALNRADAREEKYAALSRQLSGYIYDCELIDEYLANGWTTRDAFVPIILDYNRDITDLRRNEYADRAILAKYWNKDRRNDFMAIMGEAQAIDSTIHSLNNELEQVNVLKTKDKVDPVLAKSTALEIHNQLANFKPQVETLLDKLE
jgi:hypothetical protein